MTTYDPTTHKVVPKDHTVFPWAEPLAVAQRLRERHALTCSDIADHIEATHKPPRIPEPGLWGVVEAGHRHLNGLGNGRSEFVRVATTGTSQWVERQAEADWCVWSDLRDPVLIREGLS